MCRAALLIAAAAAPAQALIKSDDGGAAAVREFAGYAYDQSNGKLLYVERHRQEYEGSKLARSTVVYLDPQGKAIARKLLDYSANPYAPKFQTEDLRSGVMEAGEVSGEAYTVKFRAGSAEDIRARNLEDLKGLVADAGFDNYVRARMHDLLKGQDVHFNFVVPSRLESIQFRAAPMGVERSNERDLLRVRIEPDSALLRLFVAPGYILYDINTGELMEYVGLSNLNDDKVEKYKVRILYPNGQRPAAGNTPAANTAGSR